MRCRSERSEESRFWDGIARTADRVCVVALRRMTSAGVALRLVSRVVSGPDCRAPQTADGWS